MWVVYVHINKINGKCYVGITSREPKNRWGYKGIGYKPDKGQNPNRHFWNAIQKYGWENFSHKIIEKNLSEDEANELEKFYIEKFDSYKNGYNSTIGGGGATGMRHSDSTKKRMSLKRKGKKHSKKWCDHIRESQICKRKVICLETNEIFESPLDCSEKMHIDDGRILAVCRGANISAKGLHFQYADEKLMSIEEIERKRLKSSQTRSVECIETGEIYESINECARLIGADRRNVQRACKMYTTCGGLHYKFTDDIVSLNQLKAKSTSRQIRCIENGMVFNSAKECAEYFGLKSSSNISSVCNGKQKTFKGYHLEYISDDDLRVKKVMCINDGKIFDTQKECAAYYNISRSMVSDICNNKIENIRGLSFKYSNCDAPKRPKGSKGHTKKVRCVETGIIYNSTRDCARTMGLTPSNVSSVLAKRGRKTAGGYHFEYVGD